MFRYQIILFSCLFVYCYGKDSVSCGDSLECTDKQLKTFVDGLETKSTGEWISVKKVGRTSRQVGDDEDFIERCIRFLREHELRIRVPENENTERSFKSESRSKRLRKLILPIILLLKLKAAIVIPVVLTIISFLAFTGFKSGIAALAISGAIGLKSLLEHHGHSKISYEILPSIAPGWSRTSDEGLPVGGYQTIP